jgi:hypothetical protein
MALEDVSGSTFVNNISSDLLVAGDGPPFGSYLTMGTLAGEIWNTQPVDFDASRQSGNWKSAEGSKITFSETISDAGKKGAITIAGKPEGLKLSATWNDSWTNSSSSLNSNISYAFTGGTASKADDITYSYVQSATNYSNDSAPSFERETLKFSNADWSYGYSLAISGLSTSYKGSASNYSIKDIKNNESFSIASLGVTVDTQKNTASISASNIQLNLMDFSIGTAKYANILSATDWNSLPEILSEANNFETIASNVGDFAELFMSGDNTIAIKSKLGISIDAGSGNDIVTGGIGNDTIIGGAGKDKLTGSKGDDTFKISKSDYDFTSAKTVLADTISDFKYTATEKDSLTLDGFGDVDVFQTIALAKKAGSTANVIYESKTGNFWYNEDGDSALVGALLFANAKGISDTYWISAGVM